MRQETVRGLSGRSSRSGPHSSVVSRRVRSIFSARRPCSVRVVVIDDDPDFLEGVAALLQSSDKGIEVVGTFVSSTVALAHLTQLGPHVALVDIKMPEMDGMHCAQGIKERCPQTAVLMITGFPSATCSETVELPGACGLLIKPFKAEELKDAIRSAAHGLTVFNSAAAETVRHGRTSNRAAFVREKRLNPRETQALDLLARFLANKEIADQLVVSIPVAEKVLRNVYRKLGVRTRAEAIVVWRSAQ